MTQKTRDPCFCKLCQKSTSVVGPLQMSHIIPRFLVLKSKGPEGRMLAYKGATNSVALSQDDWKESLLCVACERHIKVYEDLLNEVFFLNRKSRVMSKTGNQLVIAADANSVALSLLSIVWRGVVSGLEEFHWAALPDYMTAEIRVWLINRSMPEWWGRQISMKLHQLLDDRGEPVAILRTPFFRDPAPTRKNFNMVFVFGGFCLTLDLPKLPNHMHLRCKTIQPNAQVLRIERVHASEIPELKEGIIRAKAANRPPDLDTKLLAMKARAERRRR